MDQGSMFCTFPKSRDHHVPVKSKKNSTAPVKLESFYACFIVCLMIGL